jgi:DNA-damage-inducible protein J
MVQTTFTMRIEEDAKEQFSDICDIFGISMASAISLFINTVNRERRIPFEITAEPRRDSDVDRIIRKLDTLSYMSDDEKNGEDRDSE